jgi:1,4-alpha-glucan branching enzyme
MQLLVTAFIATTAAMFGQETHTFAERAHARTFSVWAPQAIAVSLRSVQNAWANVTMNRDGTGTGIWHVLVSVTISLSVPNKLKHLDIGFSVLSIFGCWPSPRASHARSLSFSACTVCRYGTSSKVRPGDHYVFDVYTRDGKRFTRIDPSSADIAPDFSASVVAEPYTFAHPHRVVVAPEAAVIYELHVGSFTALGTLDGAAAKLQHIAALGINIVELMPVAASCDSTGRGWGYCPTAPYAIAATLGGSAALKRFVDAAAGHGIAVMLDVVFNHYGSKNAVLRYDGVAGEYLYPPTSQFANTAWGPRPNYGSGEPRQFLVAALAKFIDEFHIGGFRWDSTCCIRSGGGAVGETGCGVLNPEGWHFMQEANELSHGGVSPLPSPPSPPIELGTAVARARAGTFLVAEDSWGTPLPSITTPTAQGGAGFDGYWGYPWYFGTVDEILKRTTDTIDAANVAGLCAGSALRSGWEAVLFSENHDVASNQHRGRIPFAVDPTAGKRHLYVLSTVSFFVTPVDLHVQNPSDLLVRASARARERHLPTRLSLAKHMSPSMPSLNCIHLRVSRVKLTLCGKRKRLPTGTWLKKRPAC